MSDLTAYIDDLPGELRTVAARMRALIDAAVPAAPGAMWHGHPVWSAGAKPGQRPVCLLKAQSSYVTFGLWRGQEVDDASGRLESGARTMASVRLRSLRDVDEKLFTAWLRAAAALEAK